MHLCVLTSSYPRTSTDDTSVFIQRICQALGAKVTQLSLIVPSDQDEPKAETREAVVIRRFKYGIFSHGRLAFGASLLSNIQKNPFVLLQVPGFIVQMLRSVFALPTRPDAVLAFWILAAVPALLYKLLTGRPYVLGLMGSDALIFKNKLLTLLSLPLLNGAKQIVVVSHEFQRLLRQQAKIPEERISVILNGVHVPVIPEQSLKVFTQERGLSSTKHYLLAVSSLRPMKRVEVLIQLIAELPQYELIICGKTDLTTYVDSLKDLAASLGCRGRIRFLGSVVPHEVFCYMRSASYLVTASEWEGQPNAVLEAMASGLVVCASDIPAHREMIQDGENGVLFAPSEVKELAERIKELDLNPERKEALAQKASMQVSQRTWEDCAAAYARLFDYDKVA